jgi:predicted acylesterase/phospholipase RssA
MEIPQIKHLVCSGGGVNGFSFYGIFKEANKQGFWNMADIQTMYGTSVGSILLVMISLGYSWEDLDNYLIHRPWDTVYKINMYSFVEWFSRKGIFDYSSIQETFSPLLKGKDLSLEITMRELFDFNGIELHIFVTEINGFSMEDISYLTHPEWKVIDAVYSSCAVPILFVPFLQGDKCYYDGGVLMDYPIQPCLENGANTEEIFSVIRICPKSNAVLNAESSFFDYLGTLIHHYISQVQNTNIEKKGKYYVFVENTRISIQDMLKITTDEKERQSKIEEGQYLFQEFIETITRVESREIN